MALESRAAGQEQGTNYIAGEWRRGHSGTTYERVNPYRPSERIGPFTASDEEDLAEAVDAAAGAAVAWSRTPAPQRGALLTRAAELIEQRADNIADDMTREMGKPLREARGETARAATILRFFGGEGWRSVGSIFAQSATAGSVYTLRRPRGVVGLITPWNFPAAIPAWKLAPALAYGNTVVLKPARDAPLTCLHLARALGDAGLPPGVVNVVLGSGSVIGGALVAHPDVAAVSFTGSVGVGHEVRDRATNLGKPVQLELGGQNPLIVMADARLEAAADAAYAGAFWSAGQKCTATRRIYVEDRAFDAFAELFLRRIDAGRVGDPADPQTEVGPLVNESQMDDVLDAIRRGSAQGGTILAGGERGEAEAYLVAPTLFGDVTDDAALSCEEVFGPVTSLYRFGDLDEAIARANAVDYGLSAAIFTNDLRATQRFVAEVQAGLLHVNSQTAGAEAHVPFGGVKGSGFGPHEQGRAALEFYSETVTVYQDA